MIYVRFYGVPTLLSPTPHVRLRSSPLPTSPVTRSGALRTLILYVLFTPGHAFAVLVYPVYRLLRTFLIWTTVICVATLRLDDDTLPTLRYLLSLLLFTLLRSTPHHVYLPRTPHLQVATYGLRLFADFVVDLLLVFITLICGRFTVPLRVDRFPPHIYVTCLILFV